MQPDITGMLGAENEEEKNPLEKLNDAAKEAGKKETQKEKTADSFDDETFKQILMTGDNTEGLFQPYEDKEEEEKDPKHAEVHEDAQIKQGKISKPKGKYAEKFKEDIAKNPSDYKVQTPKGEMTIAEAMRKGYNPITKRFEKDKSGEEIKKKHMEGLNDADKAKLEEITSPSAAHMAPKDAAAMGLPADSPMIEGATQPPAAAMPPQGAAPVEGQATEGGLDIASMLGGAA